MIHVLTRGFEEGERMKIKLTTKNNPAERADSVLQLYLKAEKPTIDRVVKAINVALLRTEEGREPWKSK
jgi:hypothetical protein